MPTPKTKKPSKRLQKTTPKNLQKRPENLPLWAPQGVDLKVVPPEIQQVVAELIQPIYEQCVINAPDALEKSLGITITHLLWLEILEQFDIKRDYINIEAVLNVTYNRTEMIESHLRLIDTKLRIGHFLLRLKEVRQRLDEQAQRLKPPQTSLPPINPIDMIINQLNQQDSQ